MQSMIREIIVCFMPGQDGLGPLHLMSLPDHCLDVAFSTVALTAIFGMNVQGSPCSSRLTNPSILLKRSGFGMF